MKLHNLYDTVSDRIKSKIPYDNIYKYADRMMKEHRYINNPLERLCYDLLHAVCSSKEVCDWYDTYDCNDDHVFTLMRTIVKNDYPIIYNMVTEGSEK